MAKKTKRADKKSTKRLSFTPSKDRVLVMAEKADSEKTPSGIIIPDSAKNRDSLRGIVVTVGRGNVNNDGQLIPVEVTIGDTVLFKSYDGEKEEIEGNEYYLISESSILGIIK